MRALPRHLFVLLGSTIPLALSHCHNAPTATIGAGLIVGKSTSLPAALGPVNQFLGVPFAKSPPERFAPPQPHSRFHTPVNATAFKPACMQQFRYPLASSRFTQSVFNNPPVEESEDCLYLNVYAPSAPAGGLGRAVMFWIFGGSLQFGTGGIPIYDGTSFAAYEDVIVVTTNYRTNIFGFPGSTELPVTERNVGFLDQRSALDWVQRNIHAFGGDPTKVTMFGESAGGFSIDTHLTSYDEDSVPPFRAAILQSGQYTYRSVPNADSTIAWNNVTTQLGCPGVYGSNLTCVRAANASTIQNIINTNTLISAPVVDNATFVSDPAQRRLSRNIARIPVLGGTNAQEGRLFTVNQTNLTTFLQNTFKNFSNLIPAIRDAYPLADSSNASQHDAIAQIYTELVFQCPQALWANATASIGIPTWRYYFNASFPNTQLFPDAGVWHASEVSVVFGTYATANTTTQEYALGQYMRSTWAKFAKNPYAGPGWNAVGSGAEGRVLEGAYDEVGGGVLKMGNESLIEGDWSLGVLGDVGDVKGSGVTVLPQSAVDARCELFRPLFEAVGGEGAIPPS
ncbi:hypothetical protein HBI42_020270 [Parastagonospora nodorum]|nr:hypothetical protein HBI43_014630 [Parastagonospora nodorum]KAH6273318.1 hypothetical protein HBI42_020270 [Parastagonospora nodorum]